MQIPFRLYKQHGQSLLTLQNMENQEKAFSLVYAFNMTLRKQLTTGIQSCHMHRTWITA